MFRKALLIATTTLLLAGFGSASANAQDDGRHQVEVLVGYYFPSDLQLTNVGEQVGIQDDFTYGLRYGYRATDKFGLGFSWNVFDFDSARSDAAAINCSTCDFDANFFDFSAEFYPGGGDFALVGGIGWVTSDFDVNLEGSDNDIAASDDAFTFHLGLAYTWKAGENFYVRPDLRFRFVELDAQGDALYDDEDMQFTLGLGWRF